MAPQKPLKLSTGTTSRTTFNPYQKGNIMTKFDECFYLAIAAACCFQAYLLWLMAMAS